MILLIIIENDYLLSCMMIMNDDWWLGLICDGYWFDYDQDWLWLLIMIIEHNDCCMVIMDEDWLMMADWDHDW